MTAYSRAGSLKKSSCFRDLELSNDITGSIPSTVGRLQNLQIFYVMNNSLHGSIPNEFCYLRSTGVIALSKNGISGSIAPCSGGSFHSKRPVSGHPITIGVLQNLLNLSLYLTTSCKDRFQKYSVSWKAWNTWIYPTTTRLLWSQHLWKDFCISST